MCFPPSCFPLGGQRPQTLIPALACNLRLTFKIELSRGVMNDARTQDLLLKHPRSSQEGFLGRPPFEKTMGGFQLRRKCFGYTIPVPSIKVVRLPQKRVLDFPKTLPLQLQNPVGMA